MDYRVIKENDLFFLTGKDGEIGENNPYGYGLYTQDTRFLSLQELLIEGEKPILLSSRDDRNYVATFHLTNPPIVKGEEIVLWRESLEILRKHFIFEGVLYEQLTITNFYREPVDFHLSVRFDADFKDMFIVRGFRGGKIGTKGNSIRTPRSLAFTYHGADGIERRTEITWDKEAEKGEGNLLLFSYHLSPKEKDTLTFRIKPLIVVEKKEVSITGGGRGENKKNSVGIGGGNGPENTPETCLEKLKASYQNWWEETTSIESDHEGFNRMIERGRMDLRALLTDLGSGPFPVAGIPWFTVPFGRDSLITALQMLPLNPSVAKGTLFTMARYQGEKEEPWTEEQPGKIMHEIRFGELARSGQIPFTPYYGSIDATPLFLILAAEYYHWTRDRETFHLLLPHVKRALAWINQYGDRDGDSFVEYYKESQRGIANQGWKDSEDSIIHADGRLAQAPIALIEVQGYVYMAKMKWASLLEEAGERDAGRRLAQEARLLKEKVEEAFWLPEENFYAVALDREKKPVKSVTSNPGHLLMTGMLEEKRRDLVVKRLFSPDLWSGYGLRTMSTGASGYNPMSYHDGSVWPHDNSLILFGLAQHGYQEEVSRLCEGLMKAAATFEHYRLPELFCGYGEEAGPPVP
ncbi:MAG: amylo-alpha-1,6-glucosidase, partial [Thermicanus sp.]|nr:amylo-alpha-1,6-glucosidase [Thermicanus sp.]